MRKLSAELNGCRRAGARACLRALSDGRRKYSIHPADTYHWGPPYRLTLPVYLWLYSIRYRTHVLYVISSIFGEPRTRRRGRQPRPINRAPTTSCIPKAVQQTASKCVDSVARRVSCAMSIFAMRRPRPRHKKLHNLFPMSVHSLLDKRNYQCSSLLHLGFRNAPNYRQHLNNLHQCEQHSKTTPLNTLNERYVVHHKPNQFRYQLVLRYLTLHEFNCARGSSKSQNAGSISIRP